MFPKIMVCGVFEMLNIVDNIDDFPVSSFPDRHIYKCWTIGRDGHYCFLVQRHSGAIAKAHTHKYQLFPMGNWFSKVLRSPDSGMLHFLFRKKQEQLVMKKYYLTWTPKSTKPNL